MDGKLSADLLKVHNANIQSEQPKGKGTITSSASNMSGPTTTKLSMKEKILGGGGGSSHDRSDKHSESSSKISSIPGNRFARIRTKLRLHTLLGGALSKRSGSERGGTTKVLENTYKVGPDDGTKFNPRKAEEIINNVLTMYLKDRVYDDRKFPQLCKTLSDLIKERVKLSGLKRYKVIAYVTILENKKQSFHFTSRSLWESNLDNFASVTYNGPNFIAIGTLFATYFE
ncbi:dynein light chain Tctex-type 5-like [Crassostrea virginica]|uniref:Tctex1 domain-containing protein 1-like n=1 Tax=Crassostrea virginica TaxID=6565 RepID=A0A8B8E2E3_CRAVI|nr:tctex1 domain-containing protein 1-like [Crassostrea virginica]